MKHKTPNKTNQQRENGEKPRTKKPATPFSQKPNTENEKERKWRKQKKSIKRGFDDHHINQPQQYLLSLINSCTCSSVSSSSCCFSITITATFSQYHLLRFLNNDTRNEKIITVEGGKEWETKEDKEDPTQNLYLKFVHTSNRDIESYNMIFKNNNDNKQIKLGKQRDRKAAGGYPQEQ